LAHSFKMYCPNKRYCIKSKSKLLLVGENLSSHAFYIWYISV
jgi:hypothetical protein